MSKRFKVFTVFIMCLFIFAAVVPAGAASQSFGDVPSTHPFYGEIEALAAAGITEGWEEEDGTFTFRPSNVFTRMAMAAFLYGALELEDVDVENPTFADVPADHPFYGEIEALAAAGITEGWEEDDGTFTFRPANEFTRMAAAAFLYRGLVLEDADVEEASFSDVPADHPFYGEIEALAAAGITEGWEEDDDTFTFRPSNSFTRMAAAAFLFRTLGLEVEATVFSEAGVYGPEDVAEPETIEGSVIVTADGVTLQNYIITGNLTIAEEVGDGTVTLNNLIVHGELIIRGGGADSIIINGGQYSNIRIEEVDGIVRVYAVGVTDADGNPVDVLIAEGAAGEEIILEGDFDEVTINAEGVTVTLPAGSSVATMNVNASADIKGDGTVNKANVNADGVYFDNEPGEWDKGDDVEDPTFGGDDPDPTPPGPGPIPVSAITITGDAVVGATLTATPDPSGATNVTYKWQAYVDAEGAFLNIRGATSSTFVIEARLLGNTIRVVASGDNSSTATSPATAEVAEGVVSIADIPGVTAPVLGATPVTEITETAQYTGVITWDPDDDPFEAETVYTANIVLTAKAGWTLTGVDEDFFTVAGATATNAANSGNVAAEFPATGELQASTLTFAEAGPIEKTFGDATFTNVATGDGDGAITYASNDTDVATVNAATGEVTIVGVGTAEITASQAESATHQAGTATYTLNVAKAASTLAFTDVGPIAKVVIDATFTNTATGAGDGAITYASSNTDVATVDETSGEVTIVADGTAEITASQEESATHQAGTATYTLNVAKAASTIVFDDGVEVLREFGSGIYTNVVTGDGDGAITYESNNTAVATVGESSGEVTLVGVGTTVITAVKAATATHTTVTENYTLTVEAAQVTAIGAITGTPEMGQELTAGALTPTGATVDYQWQRQAGGGGDWVDISGATTSTYTVADPVVVGDEVRVVATGTGNYTGTAESAEVTIAASVVVKNAVELNNALADTNIGTIILGADITLEADLDIGNLERDVTIKSASTTRTITDDSTPRTITAQATLENNLKFEDVIFASNLAAVVVEGNSENVTFKDVVVNDVALTMNEDVTFDKVTIADNITLTVADGKVLTIVNGLELLDADVTINGVGSIKGSEIIGQKLIVATGITFEDIIIAAGLEIGADITFKGTVTTNVVAITGGDRIITFSDAADNWLLNDQVAMADNKITLDVPGTVTGRLGELDFEASVTGKIAIGADITFNNVGWTSNVTVEVGSVTLIFEGQIGNPASPDGIHLAADSELTGIVNLENALGVAVSANATGDQYFNIDFANFKQVFLDTNYDKFTWSVRTSETAQFLMDIYRSNPYARELETINITTDVSDLQSTADYIIDVIDDTGWDQATGDKTHTMRITHKATGLEVEVVFKVLTVNDPVIVEVTNPS